jgi:CDP-diacylglycerol--glycerol-3-phosphate 3-phosphatidyltransferase
MAQQTAQLYPHDRFMRPILFFIPRFITPNSITVLRFLLTPIVLQLLWIESYTAGTALFFFAAFTDAVDGSLARVRNQITRWGIFFDPIADKLLIGSVLLLVAFQYISWWIVALVLAMEITIALGAFMRRRKNKFNHANIWGKVKMFSEFVALMLLLVGVQGNHSALIELSETVLLFALIFGGISYATYSP